MSVYSLIYSRLSPIAAEFTETQTLSLQGEIEGSVGAGINVAKAEVNSRTHISQTKGSQILPKSTVQTIFKELYEYEADSLVIKPVRYEQKYPKISGYDNLLSLASISSDWVIDPLIDQNCAPTLAAREGASCGS